MQLKSAWRINGERFLHAGTFYHESMLQFENKVDVMECNDTLPGHLIKRSIYSRRNRFHVIHKIIRIQYISIILCVMNTIWMDFYNKIYFTRYVGCLWVSRNSEPTIIHEWKFLKSSFPCRNFYIFITMYLPIMIDFVFTFR